MTKSDSDWLDGYFLGYERGKEESMENIKFHEIGEAYTGANKNTYKPYIRLHLNEATASNVSYADMCEKIYLFRNDKGLGQYSVCAPLKIK
jgi:hypothetical protein